MQILVIDNNIDPDSWGAPELCALARLAQGATIHVRRAPQEDLPRDARAFDRIVLSGSKTDANEQAPWISRLDEFIRSAVSARKAVFGICYGHQTIARALGGLESVRRADEGERGWAEVHLTDEGASNPLMSGLPRSFHTFQWHQDEVHRLPRGMKLLARSEICPIQAFQLEGHPVFGVQFHPERSLERAQGSFAKRRAIDPKCKFINEKRGHELYDASIGETLFRNFLGLGQE
jgi:GMP synthase (glutamine-hydrolysing)